MVKRRDFIRNVTAGSAGLAIGGAALGFSARSYRNIQGANDRVRMGIIGVNSRGNAMGKTFARTQGAEVAVICDVDTRAISKAIKTITTYDPALPEPKAERDCRKVCEDKSIDAIYIATPDHWHTPLTILGCQGGKHVYVEKPLSHNPKEGELAVAAARKYNRIVQMGAQRRSAPNIRAGIEELHNGIIGRVYLAKTWYTNLRKETFLTPGTIPDWLDYELWQGPAPRVPYKDGLIHYNWHWFWHWGTGEALNNGTHEIDVARWGLNVDFPTRVTSVGGRYHFKDDWETPDTQVITWDFPGRISLMWENRSCNGRASEGADRGVIFYGENGSLDTDRDEYKVYNLEGKLIKEVNSREGAVMQGRDATSPSALMDGQHVADFIDAIKNNRRPNCDVEDGFKSTLAAQLGNIAWRVGHDLKIDPLNGHIIGDSKAQKLWSRKYEKGWEPKV